MCRLTFAGVLETNQRHFSRSGGEDRDPAHRKALYLSQFISKMTLYQDNRHSSQVKQYDITHIW